MIKCNIDSACRGNPGIEALAFCLGDEKGDLIYAKVEESGETSNIKEGDLTIRAALTHCQEKMYLGVIVEIDSLT